MSIRDIANRLYDNDFLDTLTYQEIWNLGLCVIFNSKCDHINNTCKDIIIDIKKMEEIFSYNIAIYYEE